MSSDDVLVVNSEGAKQIEKFCSDTAKELGLEFKDMYWSFDIVEPPDGEKYILNIKTKDDTTTDIRFSRAEINAYLTPNGAEKTKKKLRAELEGLL